MTVTDHLRRTLRTADWTRSKGYRRGRDGYPVGPHEYVMVGERGATPERNRFARRLVTRMERIIDKEGWRDTYPPYDEVALFRHVRTYLVIDDYVYWTMEDIVNREPVDTSRLMRLRLARLMRRAEGVVATWEHGDLALAVNELAASIENARPIRRPVQGTLTKEEA